MSPHDEATLSAAERAALAGLESKAEADDPRLAAALRGGIRRSWPTLRISPALVHSPLVRSARTWMGPALVVAGLAVMIVALSSITILAAAGALAFMVGAAMSAGLVRSGLAAGFRTLPSQDRRRDDGGSAASG